PQWRAQGAVQFDSWPAAVDATRTIAQAGLYPANCRLLDATEAFLNAGTSVAGGVLVLAFESADHPVDRSLARAVEICRDHGGVETPRQQRDPSADWRASFVRMPYQRDALARMSMIVETFETACTWDRFDALHASVLAAAQDAITRVAGAGVVTCRFTHVYPDGPAPYFGIYAPGRWGSTVSQWDDIKAAVSDAIFAAGGTITHHHAVGRDHRPWYDRQRPEPFAAALRAAKAALDPAGILNPGVLVD
ncbi:MAG TPA: FAD-linked oxidase C-terminal domain-containing protein, partial [Jatrophihabitantaceae bacterium]|nr:FAD-linked oxidase C-terminal domain-containing protein [Jatrophihabitantaceae bacterium]